MSRENGLGSPTEALSKLKDAKALVYLWDPSTRKENSHFPPPLQCFFSYNCTSKTMKLLYNQQMEKQIHGVALSKGRFNSPEKPALADPSGSRWSHPWLLHIQKLPDRML